jgi:hypothetical protein
LSSPKIVCVSVSPMFVPEWSWGVEPARLERRDLDLSLLVARRQSATERGERDHHRVGMAVPRIPGDADGTRGSAYRGASMSARDEEGVRR